MKLSIIGDICLSRQIYSKYIKSKYQIVDEAILKKLSASDFVLANLESPICELAKTDGDHLSFRGAPEMLEQFSFVNCFSLSNNHINDCGPEGIDETIAALEKKNISYNGIFKNEYKPIIINRKGNKIAIFTCTDMMNISFSEDCQWKYLSIDNKYLDGLIKQYKKEGYFIIIYAHVGILFSRFVNPIIRKYLHEKIEYGTDLIVTAHAHCLGGMEYYNGKPIFHSMGDFVMDGGSYRRRRAAVLRIAIENNDFKEYEIIPTIIDNELKTKLASAEAKERMLNSWQYVTHKLKTHKEDYPRFFNRQYKIEMLQHTLSTLKFLLDTKGIAGMLSLIFKRYEEVLRMGKWLTTDRSKDRRDDEAISKDRKKFSADELFKN